MHKKKTVKELLRFLLVGGINTLFTVLLYQFFVGIFSPTFSYALSWCIGMAFVLLTYPFFVFKGGRIRAHKFLFTLLSYLVSFLLGWGITALCSTLGIYPRLIIFIALFVTTTLNFVLGKWVWSSR